MLGYILSNPLLPALVFHIKMMILYVQAWWLTDAKDMNLEKNTFFIMNHKIKDLQCA